MSKQILEQGKLIGKVTHYFPKINVGIIELSDDLKVGDNIRIVGSTVDVTQIVDSMEINHQKVEKAKKGDAIGLKVKERVREGNDVYKL